MCVVICVSVDVCVHTCMCACVCACQCVCIAHMYVCVQFVCVVSFPSPHPQTSLLPCVSVAAAYSRAPSPSPKLGREGHQTQPFEPHSKGGDIVHT